MDCGKKKHITQLHFFGFAVVKQTCPELRGKQLLLWEVGAQDRHTKSQYRKPVTHQGDEKKEVKLPSSDIYHEGPSSGNVYLAHRNCSWRSE